MAGLTSEAAAQVIAPPQPKTKTPAPAPRPTTPRPATPAPGAPAKKTLAPGFEPRGRAKEWQIKKAVQVDFTRKDQTEYSKVLIGGQIRSDADKKLVQRGIAWRLSLLTHPENIDNLATLRNNIRTDLRNASSKNVFDVRDLILATIVDEVENQELLQNHFVVRLNVAILLTEINNRDRDDAKGQREIPFYGSAGTLLNVLADADQPDAVKIWSAKGVTRVGADQGVSADLRNRIVKALVDELKGGKKQHEWYQHKLLEGLGQIRVIDDPTRRPVVVQEIALVLVDRERTWLVRSEAAHTLGVLPLDNRINVPLLSSEMVRLGEQMTAAYLEKPDNPIWKQAFWQLYLAYQPIDAPAKQRLEGLLTQVNGRPALAPHKKFVEDSYKQIVPMTQAAIGSKTPVNLPAHLEAVRGWLQSNAPKDMSVAPGEAPLVKTAAETPPTSSGTTLPSPRLNPAVAVERGG